jgi:hypothetical protein
MRPFMNVNPSVRCLLKAILRASSWTEAGSAPKTKGVAGPDRNVAGAFASPLGYVPRFVPCRVSEDGEISSSDRSASVPYALCVAGTCGVGWIRNKERRDGARDRAAHRLARKREGGERRGM